MVGGAQREEDDAGERPAGEEERDALRPLVGRGEFCLLTRWWARVRGRWRLQWRDLAQARDLARVCVSGGGLVWLGLGFSGGSAGFLGVVWDEWVIFDGFLFCVFVHVLRR